MNLMDKKITSRLSISVHLLSITSIIVPFFERPLTSIEKIRPSFRPSSRIEYIDQIPWR